MPKPDRLFAIPDSEQMWPDPVAAYESQIEPRLEHYGALVEHGAHAILEEWTVAPTRTHLPTAHSVLEHISEWSVDYGMLDEFGANEITDACFAADVVVAIEYILDLIASKINYGMADKQVAIHTITWDETGPLIDGEPLYRKSADV